MAASWAAFRTEVSGYEVLHQVLAKTRRDQGEIPFAVDDDGNLFAVTDEDREVSRARSWRQGLPKEPKRSNRPGLSTTG